MTMERDEQKRRADLRRWICLVGVKGGVRSCEGKEQGAKGSDTSCPERLCLLQLSVTPLRRSCCAHSGSELLGSLPKTPAFTGQWAQGLRGRCC